MTRSTVLWAAGGLLTAGLISLLSWVFLADRPARDPGDVELVIPVGTYQKIQSGQPGSLIPKGLDLVQGDTLVVVNQDDHTHQIGQQTIPAGDTVRMLLAQSSSQTLLCSFHPSGQLGINIQGTSSPLNILWPTLILGIPFGIVAGIVQVIFSRLETSAAPA